MNLFSFDSILFLLGRSNYQLSIIEEVTPPLQTYNQKDNYQF
ncbi:MAG: hypothetical protein AAGJ08_10610 [Cyanobacteria bacterium P01_H01_bin.35]